MPAALPTEPQQLIRLEAELVRNIEANEAEQRRKRRSQGELKAFVEHQRDILARLGPGCAQVVLLEEYRRLRLSIVSNQQTLDRYDVDISLRAKALTRLRRNLLLVRKRLSPPPRLTLIWSRPWPKS